MPWIYHQRTGALYHDKKYIATGWAGHGIGKFNPVLQGLQGVGPLPRGTYTIGRPFDYRRTAAHPHGTGPYSMRLTSNPHDRMFGRGGFLIHGASTNPNRYGQESDGCIVMPLWVRQRIGTSHDHMLEVVK